MQDQNSTDDQANQLDFTALIRELGIDQMPPDQQQQVMSDVFDAVNVRALERLAQTLTPEQQEQINVLTALNPAQAKEELLKIVPKEQQTQIYQEEIEAVKEDIKREATGPA